MLIINTPKYTPNYTPKDIPKVLSVVRQLLLLLLQLLQLNRQAAFGLLALIIFIMEKYTKIYKMDWENLSLKERAVYTVIACKSNYLTHKSSVQRQTIAKCLGIKNLDLISKITDSLEKKHWIEKTTHFDDVNKKRTVEYTIVDGGSYEFVSTDIIDAGLSVNDLGIMVSLLLLRDDNIVDYVNLYETIGVSNSTYYRSFTNLKKLGYISSKDGVITINDFIPSNLSQKNVDWCTEVLKYGDPCSKEYRAVKRCIETNFKDINNPNAYIASLMSGLGFKPGKYEGDDLTDKKVGYALD